MDPNLEAWWYSNPVLQPDGDSGVSCRGNLNFTHILITLWPTMWLRVEWSGSLTLGSFQSASKDLPSSIYIVYSVYNSNIWSVLIPAIACCKSKQQRRQNKFPLSLNRVNQSPIYVNAALLSLLTTVNCVVLSLGWTEPFVWISAELLTTNDGRLFAQLLYPMCPVWFYWFDGTLFKPDRLSIMISVGRIGSVINVPEIV